MPDCQVCRQYFEELFLLDKDEIVLDKEGNMVDEACGICRVTKPHNPQPAASDAKTAA